MADVTLTTETAATPRESVEFFFDPMCPFAWMTSRWMEEVERIRPVDVTWRVMSLAVLNEGRELSPGYREFNDNAWGPVRVITKAIEDHGQEYAKKLYDAIGTRRHPGGRDEITDIRPVVEEAVAEVGLPESLLDVYDTEEVDAQLRASHQRAMDLVGDEVGTPVIKIGEVAFFGPVVVPAPRGEAAGRLWDGCLLVAGTDGFYELKRSRDRSPQFD